MKARILDTWDIELPDSSSEEKWWLDWAVAAPKHAGDHLRVSFRTFEALTTMYDDGAIFSAREYFGGIGAHAIMVDELFRPAVHTVADYSPQAVEHMRRVLPAGIGVSQTDAYGPTGFDLADLHVMDFGDLTVFQAQPGKERGDLLERVFRSRPMAVTITDIAARYLHLQKKSYEPILGAGACDSYEEYLERYSRHLEDRFGYVLLEGNYTRWSCHMAFVPTGLAEHGSFRKYDGSLAPGLVLS